MSTEPLSNPEVARLLIEVDASQPLGPELHTALIRLSPPVAIEAVALRRNEESGLVEVLLRQRGPNEPAYPGHWHCPGSFVRNNEQVEDVLTRLTKGESLGRVISHQFAGPFLWPEERGWICSLVTLVTVRDVGSQCFWHPVDHLPNPMVPEHATDVIPMGLDLYRRQSP